MPTELVAVSLAAGFSVQGWILLQLSDLKTAVAILTSQNSIPIEQRTNPIIVKRNMKNIRSLLSLLAVIACLCAPAPAHALSWLYKPGTNVVFLPWTNNITTVVTNTVTNTVTGVIQFVPVTNTVQTIVERPQTNSVINPALVTGVQTAQTVAGFLPPPWDGIITGIGSLVLGALGIGLKIKGGQLSTANSIIGATVAGVEAANDSATKQSIQQMAAAAGVQSDLHSIVQSMTEPQHPGPIIPPKT